MATILSSFAEVCVGRSELIPHWHQYLIFKANSDLAYLEGLKIVRKYFKIAYTKPQDRSFYNSKNDFTDTIEPTNPNFAAKIMYSTCHDMLVDHVVTYFENRLGMLQKEIMLRPTKPTDRSQSNDDKFYGSCFNCGEKGHFSSQCPADNDDCDTRVLLKKYPHVIKKIKEEDMDALTLGPGLYSGKI